MPRKKPNYFPANRSPDPTVAEIKAELERIRAEWSPAERARRCCYPVAPVTALELVDDFTRDGEQRFAETMP